MNGDEVENNDKQEALKKIIKDLHAGKSVDQVKKDFGRLIRNVSHQEIAAMEQRLIDEGFPVEEIQRLCEVHVDVFKQSLDKEKKPHNLPGHPIHTFMLENKEVSGILKTLKPLLRKIRKADETVWKKIEETLANLEQINVHYTRKENQLFPYLEKHGFTGPSKVMWGKHDEIRALFKEAKSGVDKRDKDSAVDTLKRLTGIIGKMIFMEEKILFPNALKRISEKEWAQMRKGEGEIGYAWVKPGNLWDANVVLAGEAKTGGPALSGLGTEEKTPGISLQTGTLTPQQINMMLKALPVDISFVDENDKVLYYSDTAERVFPRSPGVIGRSVQNCHPPKSVKIVEDIVASFRRKEKDKAEFWLDMNGRFIHIRYFPLYDENGDYRGVLEVSQDATDIRNLTGEKRLLDW